MQGKEYWLVTPREEFLERLERFGESRHDDFLTTPVLWSAKTGGRVAREDYTIFAKLLFLCQRLQLDHSVARIFEGLPITESSFDRYYRIVHLRHAESSEEVLYPAISSGRFFDIPETGKPGVDQLLDYWRSRAAQKDVTQL